MIQVILVDDHQLFTEGLCSLFENDADLCISAVYKQGASFLQDIEFLQADILLLDIKMARPDGLEILEEIRKRGISIKVIMLSTYADQLMLLKSRQLGADAYLLKNTSREELKNTIQQVMHGNACFGLLGSTAQDNNEKFRYFNAQYKITRREWEILLLIKQNNTNQMISEALHLSIYTVETHRKNLMQKLHLKTPLSLHHFIQLHDI